jgi:hypothetical protein
LRSACQGGCNHRQYARVYCGQTRSFAARHGHPKTHDPHGVTHFTSRRRQSQPGSSYRERPAGRLVIPALMAWRSRCACRKSNTHIQMMESAEEWRRHNATSGMYCSRDDVLLVSARARPRLCRSRRLCVGDHRHIPHHRGNSGLGNTTLGDLTIGALERLFNALPRRPRACVVVTNLKDDVYLDGSPSEHGARDSRRAPMIPWC